MRYFKNSEFDQKGLSGSGAKMNPAFLIHLDELRHRCGFPFKISSGYRSPEYNAKVSSSGLTGAHTTGKACDIAVSQEQAYIVLKEASKMGVFTGIGINQKGNGRFIHLDTCTQEDNLPRPAIWSYLFSLVLISPMLFQAPFLI
jgi:zinc D-Ala-D-Ala carboxypeptidase